MNYRLVKGVKNVAFIVFMGLMLLWVAQSLLPNAIDQMFYQGYDVPMENKIALEKKFGK